MEQEFRAKQYSDIVWSRTTEFDTEGDSYGLIRIYTPQIDLKLDRNGVLKPPHPLNIHRIANSNLIFGRELRGSTIARSDKTITLLDDANWINQVGEETRVFLKTLHQSETTGKVVQLITQLQQTLQQLSIISDPEAITDAGLLEELVKRQSGKILPSRLISIAEKLKTLGVTEFGEVGIIGSSWTPDWIIEFYPKSLQQTA